MKKLIHLYILFRIRFNALMDFFFARKVGSRVILKDRKGKVKGWETRGTVLSFRRDDQYRRLYQIRFDEGWVDFFWEDELR